MKIEYQKTFKMMLSLFWKNSRFPKKGQNGAKVGGAVGKNQLFLYIAQNWLIVFFGYLASKGHKK